MLGCAKFGLADPVSATVDGDGVATAISYKLTQQKATLPVPAGGNPMPTASPSVSAGTGLPWFGAPPRRHRHHQNGTGM